MVKNSVVTLVFVSWFEKSEYNISHYIQVQNKNDNLYIVPNTFFVVSDMSDLVMNERAVMCHEYTSLKHVILSPFDHPCPNLLSWNGIMRTVKSTTPGVDNKEVDNSTPLRCEMSEFISTNRDKFHESIK